MPRSFHNKILRVNLTTETISTEEPGPIYFRHYLGGWNIIADVLLREVPAHADPLGPQNKLIFAPGIITGLPFSGSSRSAVGAKSPLTGGFGAAEAGGDWPAEFKRAGFDVLIVDGISPKPVYLWIKDGQAELRDAGHLWGKDSKETQDLLEKEMGDPHCGYAMIGPAGENLVRYACIMNETKDAAGRTGLGAVMGSKKLKAVVARGTKALAMANPEKIHELAVWMSKGVQAGEQAAWVHTYGTGTHLENAVLTGNLPIRNFRDGEFAAAADISANTIMDKIGVKMEGCWACSVRCKKVVRTDAPHNVDPAYGGPEYETIGSVGSCCGVGDIEIVSRASQLCNAYGLDSISTGVSVAFGMECFENGLVTEHDTGGIDLRFGNGDALLAMIHDIAHRARFGAVLAEGAARAAQQIGGGSLQFAMQAKGQEYPMHEPRFKRALAIAYSLSPTGADHNHALHDANLTITNDEGMITNANLRSMGVLDPVPVEDIGPAKVRATLYNTIYNVMANCAVVCSFVPWAPFHYGELVRAATGWDVSDYELLKVGERALTLARLFNVREGFSVKDDVLAGRSYGPTTGGALVAGGIKREALEQAAHTYYGMMGWDRETGVPTAEKLEELDIAWAGDRILP